MLDRTHSIVIIAAPGLEKESAIRLGRIGFDHIAGYLHEGLHSLKSRPDLTIVTERLSAPFAAELLSSPEPTLNIDVRALRERDQKFIAGSLGFPLNHLAENLEKLPKDRPILVYCAGGYRSSIAASLLQSRGFQSVKEIAGGIGGGRRQSCRSKPLLADARGSEKGLPNRDRGVRTATGASEPRQGRPNRDRGFLTATVMEQSTPIAKSGLMATAGPGRTHLSQGG